MITSAYGQRARSILGWAAAMGCLGSSLEESQAQQPVVLDLAPMKDNSIFEENENSNGKGEWLFAGLTENRDDRRALLSFDVARQIPAGATITAVVLELTMDRTIAGSFDFELRRMTKDWGESGSDAPDEEGKGTAPVPGDATWNFAEFNSAGWTSEGGDFAGTASASTPVDGIGTYQWSSAPLIQDVQGWLDGTTEDFGWVLLSTTPNATTAKRFKSRETELAGERPVLRVTYTSEALPSLRPDGVIREKNKSPKGDGVYSLGGAGQLIRLKGRSGARFSYSLLVQNDGNLKDDFTIQATRGDRHFQAAYLRFGAGGSANVTGKLTRGTLGLEGLRAGESVRFLAKVKSKKKRAGRSRSRLFTFLTRSAVQPALADLVKAKLSTKR